MSRKTRQATVSTNGAGPDGEDRLLHTFSTGITIEIMTVPTPLIQRVINQVELPEQPTKQYKLDLGDGDSDTFEEVPLDEATATTDEDRVRLAEYEVALNQALSKRRKLEEEAMLLEGARILDDEEMERHLSRLAKRYGLEIPDDEDDRTLFYLQNCVIGGDVEMIDFRLLVYQRQGLSREALQAVRDSFRREVERETARAIGDATERMEIQSVSVGDEDS